jgi:hypothetical protein
MTKHLSARPVRALIATLAVMAAYLCAAAPPASANTCNYDGFSFNACLRFDPAGYGYRQTHVGIDVYMARQHAQEILDCGPNFSASLWGDDGSSDQFILPLSLKPGWPAVGDTALGAEFGSPRIGAQLDEDPGKDQDELYVKITFFDCYRSQRTYYTGTVRGDFRFTGF